MRTYRLTYATGRTALVTASGRIRACIKLTGLRPVEARKWGILRSIDVATFYDLILNAPEPGAGERAAWELQFEADYPKPWTPTRCDAHHTAGAWVNQARQASGEYWVKDGALIVSRAEHTAARCGIPAWRAWRKEKWAEWCRDEWPVIWARRVSA